ncbi:TetR/AcrR family transcriptional regulator C-terminal domain-containing protein [Agromyces sp. NPDC055520]
MGEHDETSATGAAALLWAEPPGRRPGPRPKFTLAGIAAAAIAIADDAGLDEVTMQRIADRLGTTKMALYRYLPGRAELDAVMLDTALGAPGVGVETGETGAVDAPRAADVAGDDWRAALTAWADGVHARATAHPWIVELVQRPHTPGPIELGWYEAGLAAVAGLPLRGGEQLDLLVLLVGHVMSIARQRVSGAGSDDALAAGLTVILVDRGETYPRTASAFAEAGRDGARDDALRFGVERVLAGVDALVAERSASASASVPARAR